MIQEGTSECYGCDGRIVMVYVNSRMSPSVRCGSDWQAEGGYKVRKG